MENPTFEIIDQIGVISVSKKTGWSIELNLVSWNNQPPKYEIRFWSPDHTAPGKGLMFSDSDLKRLASILNEKCGFLTER